MYQHLVFRPKGATELHFLDWRTSVQRLSIKEFEWTQTCSP